MIDDHSIRERERQLGFAVRQFHIVARGREVDQWDQPLIDSQGIGRLSLVCQRRRSTLMFLVKANREIGFLEGVQLAPPISFPTSRQHHARDPMESDLLELAVDTARLHSSTSMQTI